MSTQDDIRAQRLSGLSYREISERLGVSRGSVGLYASDIHLTQEQEQALRDRVASQARLRADRNRAERKERPCPKCGDLKSVEDFYKRGDLPVGYCKACQRDVVNVQKRVLRVQFRAVLRTAKNKPCMDCGSTFEPFAMDFDHRDPTTKRFDVGRAGSGSFTVADVLAEIAKCDVVCAVCHRYRTAGKRRRLV